MSILFRIFGWIGGILSSLFGMWMTKKVMEKTAATQAAPKAAAQATEEPKQGKS